MRRRRPAYFLFGTTARCDLAELYSSSVTASIQVILPRWLLNWVPAGVWRCALPVRHSRRRVRSFARVELDHRSALERVEASALFAQDDLTVFMRMPLGAGARREVDVGESRGGVLRHLVNRAGEVRIVQRLSALLGDQDGQTGGKAEGDPKTNGGTAGEFHSGPLFRLMQDTSVWAVLSKGSTM